MKKLIYSLLSCVIFCSCVDKGSEPNPPTPPVEDKAEIISFSFLSSQNSDKLLSDVHCSIDTNNVIECLIPYILDDKELIPTFQVSKGNLMYVNDEIESGESILDCSSVLRLRLETSNDTVFYSLKVRQFTGLPIVYITTDGYETISSTEEYINGSIKVVSDFAKVGTTGIFESTMQIRGRGNSTWNMPKKPYKIKFDEKKSLLGMPADKEWVLLANYSDKSLLRLALAFYMGEMSEMEYTPRSKFVEVVINGVYNGTYQLCEQLKVSKDRVNVGDDGYLLEIDARATEDERPMTIPNIYKPVIIKDKKGDILEEDYQYVSNYLNKTTEVIFSSNFKDPEEGYAKYIDVWSFIDWYLINEIGKNNDAIFWASCYMNLPRNGKLCMGPLWDFDIAFGNNNKKSNNEYEGFYLLSNIAWYKRLFTDEAFVQKVKERFNYYYDNRNVLFGYLNSEYENLKYAAEENNNKWDIFYTQTWPNFQILGSYQNEVQSLKTWLNLRLEWLKIEFDKM